MSESKIKMRGIEFKTREQLETHLRTKDNKLKDTLPKKIDFWLRKDNRWNTPGFSSKKMHKFWHAYHEKYLEREKQLLSNQDPEQELINQDNFKYKYNLGEDYKRFVKTRRVETKNRLTKAKLERLVLQQASLQDINHTYDYKMLEGKLKTMDFQKRKKYILNRSAARHVLKKNPPNLWNDFTNKSDKLLGLYLRPQMLKNEDEAVQRMKLKIKGNQKEEFYKKIYRSVLHDVIRYNTQLKQKNKNKLGTRTLNVVKKIKNPHMYFYRKKMKKLLSRKRKINHNQTTGSETDLMQYSKLQREASTLDDPNVHFDIDYVQEFGTETMNLEDNDASSLKNGDRQKKSLSLGPRHRNINQINEIVEDKEDFNAIQAHSSIKNNLISHFKQEKKKRKSKSINIKYAQQKKAQNQNLTHQLDKSQTTLNDLKNHSKTLFERLAQPKQKINSFDIQYFNEFNNMMIRDVTPQTAYFDNNYIQTLIRISDTAKKRSGLFKERDSILAKVEENRREKRDEQKLLKEFHGNFNNAEISFLFLTNIDLIQPEN